MSEIVTITEKEIRMNSQMDELSFGKTSYNTIVTQKGVLAVAKITEDRKYNFEFSDWTFSDIKAYDIPEKNCPIVFYCAKNTFSPELKTYLTIVEKGEAENASKTDKDNAFEAGFALCSLLTQAALTKKTLPINGAGGILFDKVEDTLSILILPGDLFKYSSGGLSSRQISDEHSGWINPTLYDLPALCFNRAVIAYKMLSGKYPYTSTDTVERNADMMDRNFLPVELCVNGINPVLAKEINRALKLNSNAINIPGKKQKGKSSEDLTPTETFPLELLYAEKDAEHKTKITDEELSQKAESYMKAKQSKVNTKRRLRRNTAAIITTLIVIAIGTFITWNMIKTNLDEGCSKGLTATQTIETLFKAVNDKDSVLMSNISDGGNTDNYIRAISHIYVIGKQRRTYDNDQGFMSPEGYLYFATDNIKNQHAGVYGVTNLTIQGQVSDLHPPVVLRRDKVDPVTMENGKEIQNGDVVKYDINYYLLHSEDLDNRIEVEKVFDTITLTYKKDRWIITDLESSSFVIDVNSPVFKSDYYTALSLNDGDVIKAVDSIREKYQWLPSNTVLEFEKQRIIESLKDPLLPLY